MRVTTLQATPHNPSRAIIGLLAVPVLLVAGWASAFHHGGNGPRAFSVAHLCDGDVAITIVSMKPDVTLVIGRS